MFDIHSTTVGAPCSVEREWADCSGAVLSVLVANGLAGLEQLPDTLAGDVEALDLARATMRVEGWAATARAKAVAQVYTRTFVEHQRTGQARASHAFDDAALTRSEVAANLSLELGISLTTADREVRFALALTRHPELALALATGRIHTAQARTIVSELSPLKPWVRQRLVPALVADPAAPDSATVLVRELQRPGARVWDLPIAKLKTVIRREAAALDPQSVTARADAGRFGRGVRYYSGPDNIGELVLRGPEDQLTAVMAHLDATAGQARRAGASGSLDQLRFDIAIGSLTEGTFGLHVVRPQRPADAPVPDRQVELPPRPGALINVTAPAPTPAGGNEPGVLHGPDGDTPLPAEVVRELAYDKGNAIWRMVLCDPQTGQVRSISHTYQPSQALRDFVICRDGYASRFPTSTTRRRIELDHIDEFDHTNPITGGSTSTDNLAVEGLREHRLKTDRGFFISGDANGCLTYRTRSGRTYESWPAQHMRPIPGLGLNAPLDPPSIPKPTKPPPDYGGEPPF